jgi:hypothetical protein
MNTQLLYTACLDCGKRVTGDSIHTCSPQLKTLTDEEIKLEAKYFCHSWYSQNPERLVLFARAILRKAQEK